MSRHPLPAGIAGRALSLATYPLARPLHGGQIRAAAINGALAAAGWTVRHCCVIEAAHGRPDGEEWTFVIPDERLAAMAGEGERPDVDASAFLLEDGERMGELGEALRDFAPDLLVFHQPWLWPALRLLLPVLPHRPGLIYSSQNREGVLMAELSGCRNAPDPVAERADAIERDLLDCCDGLICVSEADRQGFAHPGPSLVLRNGVWPFPVEPPAYCVFVGSAHPPNAEGFVAMLPSLDVLPAGVRIVVAGGVGTLLAATGRYDGSPAIEFTGPVGGDRLAGLLAGACAILLPIVSGGGTNLKTAEAIYSQKPVVGTSKAFRGFEDFLSAPGIHIADTPEEFRDAIGQVVAQSASGSLRDASALAWPVLLEPLAPFVMEAMGRSNVGGRKGQRLRRHVQQR